MQSSLMAHAVRVTARIQVGNFHREVDLSLPSGTTMADALPEILALAQAPRITRPWRAATAAGVMIDQAVPIHLTPLEHGSVFVLTPAEPVDAPIVRDSAEALADSVSPGAGAVGGAQAATIAGIAGAVGLLTAVTDLVLALAGGAAVALVLVTWHRHAQSLAIVAIFLATAAGFVLVEPAGWQDAAWAVIAGGTAGVSAHLVCVLLGVLRPRAGAAVAVVLLTGLVAAGGMFLPGWTAVPAVVLLFALLVITVGPSLVTSWAGLKVPVLPTAGQDLAVSDGHQSDVDKRATRAIHLADGGSLGLAAVTVPAVAALGWHGGGWAQAACVLFAAAILLHAGRHAAPIPAWSLTIMGVAAGAASVLATVRGDSHPVMYVVATLVAVVALTSLWWAPRVRDLEPTTVVWLERAEFTALLACLPVLVQLMGVFAWIRGLG